MNDEPYPPHDLAPDLRAAYAELSAEIAAMRGIMDAVRSADDASRAEVDRLRADVAGLRVALADAAAATEAERVARRNAEADLGWWHATVANYVTSATIEDRELLRGTLAEATTYPHAGTVFLAELYAARAVVAAARTGFGTEEDIRRAWAFDPSLLTARIRAYDKATKARTE